MHDAATTNLSLDSSVHAGSSAYAGPSERGQQLSRRPSATRLGSKSPVVAEGDEAGERAETGQSGSKRRRLASRGSRASTDAEHYNGEEGDGSAAAGALDSPSLVAALLPSFGRPVENIYGRSYSADRTHTGTGSVTAVHSRRRARASSSSYAAAANAGVPTTLGDDDTAGGVPAAGGEGGSNTAASTAAAPHRFASFEEGSSPPAAADISASAAIPMQLSRALQQAQLQQYQQQKLQQQYQQQQLYKQQPQYQQQQQQEPAAEHLAGALPSTAYWSNLLSFREGGDTAPARLVTSILSPSQQLQHTPPSTSAAAAAAAGAVDAASVQLASPPPVTASQQQLKQMRHAHIVMHQRGASAAVGGPFDSSSSSSNSGGGGGGGGGFNSRMADAFGRLDHHQQQQQRAPYTQQTHSGGGGHGISSASSSRSTHSDLTSHSLRGGSGGGGSAPVSVLTSTTFGSSLPSLCNSARSEQFEDYDHEGKLISNGHDMGIPLPPQPIDSGGVNGGMTRSHDLGVSGAARVPENIAQWQQFDASVANRTAAQAQIQLHQAQAHLHSGIVQLPLGTAATVRRINHAHPFDVTAASARGDPPLSLPLHSMYAVDAVGRVASPPLTSLPPPPPPFARSASDRSSSSSEGDDVAKYAMQTQTQQQQTPQAMFSPHLLDLGSPTSCGGPLTSEQHSQYRASDGSTAAAVVDRSRSTGGGGIVSCGNNHDLQAVVGTPPAMLVQKLMHRPPAPALPQSPQSCTDETRGPVAVAAAATVAAPQHDPQQRSAPAAARVWHTQTPPPPQLRVRIPQMERRQRSLSDSDTPSAIRSNIALSGVVKNNTQQPDPGLYMCDLTTGYRGDEASRAAAARVIRSSPHSSPRAATAGDIEPEAAASYSAEEQRGDRLQQQQQQQSRSRGSIAHTSRPPPVPLLAIPKNGLLQPQALLAIPKEGLPQPQAQARVLDASSAQNQGQQSSSPPFPLQLLPLQLPKSGSIAAPATGGERRAAEVVSAAANILQTRLQLDEHQRNLRALKQQLQQQQQQQHPDTRAVVLGGIGDLTARVISMDEDRTPRALAATADATRAAARSTVHNNNNNNSSGGGSGGATHAVASMTLGGFAEAAAVAPSSEAHRHLDNGASASAGSGDWSLPQPHQQLQQQLMMPSISSLTAAAATACNGAPVARSNFSQMVHLHDHPPSAAASVSQQHPGNDHHLAPYTNMTIFSPFSPEAPMGYEHTAAGAAAPRAPPPPPMMLHTLHLGTEEPRYLGGNGSSSSSSSSALTHPMSATPRLLAGEDANKLFAMGSRIWDLALPATVLQQQQHAGHAQHDGSSSLSDIVSTKTIVSQNPWNNGTRPSISSQVYAQPPRQMVAHPADADGQASPALGQAELAPFIALSSSSSAAAANANASMHNDIDDHEGQFSHSMGEGTAVSWTDETQHHAVHVQAPPPTAVAQLNLGGLGNRSGASSGRSGADRGVSEGAHANKYHNSAGGPWSKQHTDTDVSEAEHLLLLSARDRCESVPAVDDTRTGTSTTLPPRLDDDDPFVRSCSRSSTPNGAAAPTAAAATRKTTHFSGTQALSLRTDTSSDAAAAATGLGVGGDGSSKWPPLVFHDMLRPGSSTGGGLSEPLPSHPPARIRSSSRINSRHSASSEALDSPSHMVVQPSRSAVATAAAVPAPRHPHYYGKGGGGGGADVTEREWKCTPQSPTHRVSRGKSSSSSSSSSMFSSSSSSASRLPPSPTSSSVMNAAFHLHAAANSAYDASQQQQQQHVFQAQQPGALQQQAQLQQLHAMSHSDVPQQQQQQQLPSAATRAPAQSQYGLRERRVRRSYHDDDDCGDEEENEASATGAAEEKAGETYQYLREDGSDDPPSADDDEDDADFGEGSRSRKGRTQNKRAKRSHGSSAAAAATATGNLSVGSAASAADSTERDHSSSHPTGTSVSSSRRRATAGSNKTSARPPQQQQLVRATSSSSSSSSSANSGTARARWTAEEDDILYSLKTSGVQMTWPAIAAHLPGRSASRCQERWANHLDREFWSLVCGRTLCKYCDVVSSICLLGACVCDSDTRKCALHAPFLSCYPLCLSPLSASLKSEPWTPKEDEILSQKFAEMGPKWGEITEFLPGR